MFQKTSAALEALADAMAQRLRDGRVAPDSSLASRKRTEAEDEPNSASATGQKPRSRHRRPLAYRFGAGSLVSLLLTLSLVVVSVSPAVADGGVFVDDDGSVHEANIELLADAGITVGCGVGVFCPEDPVTRGEMATFVVRALGYVDDAGGDLFVDDDVSVHRHNIDLLAGAGVTLGCNPPDNDRFCPGDPVTRGQMASFLVRAFHYNTGFTAVDRFSDDDGSIHESDINLLFRAGVTSGCNPPDNDRFCPHDSVTRAEMATFLVRALHLPWPIDHSDNPDLVPEASDQFGSAVVLGDFNADGWDDIAVGTPGKNKDRGAVRVIYGTAGGPTGSTQFLDGNTFDESLKLFARFGSSLAAGDFDDDGYDDLAIAATVPDGSGGMGTPPRGYIVMARGGSAGLTSGGVIIEGPSLVSEMAAGQFGNGSADDLAVGFQGAEVNMAAAAGTVGVVYGSTTGFSSPVFYHQDTLGVLGVVEAFDRFGWSVAAGDLTGDGFDELAIGVAFEDLIIAGTNVTDVGVVHVFYGSDLGLLVDNGGSPQLFHQEHVGGEVEEGDRFGSDVAIGDLTGDGIGDLTVGAPGEDLDSPLVGVSHGDVSVLPGSSNGPVGDAAFGLGSVAGAELPLGTRGLGYHVVFLRDREPVVAIASDAAVPAVGVFLLRAEGLVRLDTPILEPDFDTFSELASGDIDGDGNSDLVIGSAPMLESGGIAMWLGQADGSLELWAGGLIQ